MVSRNIGVLLEPSTAVSFRLSFSKPVRAIALTIAFSAATSVATAQSPGDGDNYESLCAHCHNATIETLASKRIIRIDEELHTAKSKVPLSEFLRQHFTVLEPAQIDAVLVEIDRVVVPKQTDSKDN